MLKKLNKLLIIFVVIIVIIGLAKLSLELKPVDLDNNKDITPEPKYKCSRTERYDNPAEFDRALSLYNQRKSEYYNKLGIKYSLITPCIIVKYANLKPSGSLGVFNFSDKDAKADYLPIYVDFSYRESDDILTAILLSHEITHASQYLEMLNGIKQDCYKSEIEAFNEEYSFMTLLNDEEKQSLIARTMVSPKQSIINQVSVLLYLGTNAHLSCSNIKNQIDEYECASQIIKAGINKMVYENPNYRQQCSEK